MPKHPKKLYFKIFCVSVIWTYMYMLVCKQVHTCGHRGTTSSVLPHMTGSLNCQQGLGLCLTHSPA